MKKICNTLLLCLIFCYFPTSAISNNATYQNDSHDAEQIIHHASNPTIVNDTNKPEPTDPIFSFEISKGQLEKYHQNHFIKSWEKKADFFFAQLKYIFLSSYQFPEEIKSAFLMLFSKQGTYKWEPFQFVLGITMILITAFCVELFFRKKLSKILQKLKENTSSGVMSMLLRLVFYTLIDLLFLHIFSLISIVLYILIFRNSANISNFVMQIIFTIIVVRSVLILSKFILSPFAPTLRLLPIGEKDAIYIYRWSIAIVTISVCYANSIIQLRILGMSHPLFILLYSFSVFLPINMVVYMIWDKRDAVASIIKSTHSEYEHIVQIYFASNWHIYATLYSYIMWLFWEINLIMTCQDYIFSFIASFVIIPLYFAVDAVIWRMLCIAFGHTQIPHHMVFNMSPDFTKNLEAALNPRAIHYIRSILRIIRIGMLGMLFIWVKNLWGFGHSLEKEFAKATFIISFTVLIAYSVWEFIKVFIDENTPQNYADYDNQTDQAAYHSRIQTLLSIFRNFLLIILLIIVCLIIMFSIGINIVPFLAGAGVIGLGIGFGTQTLIKDFFSGIFFLIDDAFRIGDYVETGNEKGTVENISLRSIRLRHHRGMVYTIPFGELRSITNYSRDWIVMNVDFQVPFKTEMNQVESIISKINKQISQDSELKEKLLDSLNFMGIKKIENFGIVIRTSFKSKPGEQFIARKLIYKYIHFYFEQEGINFVNQNITLQLVDI
jgi:small-conductance mechanosensitive channel